MVGTYITHLWTPTGWKTAVLKSSVNHDNDMSVHAAVEWCQSSAGWWRWGRGRAEGMCLPLASAVSLNLYKNPQINFSYFSVLYVYFCILRIVCMACAGVNVCVYRYVHTCTCMLIKAKDQCWVTFLPYSLPYLLRQSLSLNVHAWTFIKTWVLGVWTQLFMSVQQSLYLLSYLSSLISFCFL